MIHSNNEQMRIRLPELKHCVYVVNFRTTTHVSLDMYLAF